VPTVSKSSESTPSKVSGNIVNGHAVPRNSRIEVRIPSYSPSHGELSLTTPPQPTPQTWRPLASIAVVVPQASDTLKTEEYVPYLEDPPTPESHDSLKRKRSELSDDELQGTGSNQQAKLDETFRSLQELTMGIFEVEDSAQAEGPDGAAVGEYFTTSDEGVLSLDVKIQTRLDNLISKLIQDRRFKHVPVDDLVRLEKVCEASIKASATLPIRLDRDWGETDAEPWFDKLPLADIGIKSARTALRMMTGDREEKQLYSEEIMNASLAALKNTLDCLVQIVEMRPFEAKSSTSDLFRLLSARQKDLASVLSQCRRLLMLFRELVGKKVLSEEVLNSLEFMVSNLIFVENARSDKDSVLGIQRYDNLRVAAMDCLVHIFTTYPDQRRGIIDQILTSLEKLPVNKLSARQFKLLEGGSIQPVSALLMQLVQASASRSEDVPERKPAVKDEDDQDEEDDDLAHGRPVNGHRPAAPVNPANDTESRAVVQHATAVQQLQEVLSPVHEAAKASASYIASFIIQRAETSTKSGESPYRNLLDLFIQDFLTCLTSPQWPASELLLYAFLVRMVQLSENEKTPAPAKTMALDVLVEMAREISRLNAHMRKAVKSLESADAADELANMILTLAESSIENDISLQDLVTWNGAYRVVLDSLLEQSTKNHFVQGALGYYMTMWGSQVVSSYDEISDEDPHCHKMQAKYGVAAYRLRKMLTDRDWLRTEYTPKPLSHGHAQLAYNLILMGLRFCAAYDRIFAILLSGIRSEQITVRSKALKCINQILETDPAILDRSWNLMQKIIISCAEDKSVSVRDAVLGLIGQCIGLRPDLEKATFKLILLIAEDSNIGVRKRAIKLLKDIYLKNDSPEVKSQIACALLHRISDLDEGVQELTRQIIEEIWMQPYWTSVAAADDLSVPQRLALRHHVFHIVETVTEKEEVDDAKPTDEERRVFVWERVYSQERVLTSLLSNASKHYAENFRVCKALVATMFEIVIDTSNGRLEDSRNALQLLRSFAKVDAKLFTAQQIQLLPPYLQDLNDGRRFRSVVIIFRHVFPSLPATQIGFLTGVRDTLMKSIARLTPAPLDDAVACLWIIAGVLDNREGLARLAASCLKQIHGLSKQKFPDDMDDPVNPLGKKVLRLVLISSTVGKHCDLDDQQAILKDAIPSWPGGEVSKLMVNIFAPLTASSQPLYMRKAALDAVGIVCQSWPTSYRAGNITNTFQRIFDERIPDLEEKILASFREFLLGEEKRSEPGTEVAIGAANETAATLGVMGGSKHDGVAMEIGQKFLKDIKRVALASINDQAFMATEILASISRQGMNHPNQYCEALVALSTSDSERIAGLAFKELRTLHEKHETILETIYPTAVHSAYEYHRDVLKDSRGARTNPFTPKLYPLIEVQKISKIKSRKKFFTNLVSRIRDSLPKVDVTSKTALDVEYARFLIENLAFFEYQSIDELLGAINAFEKLVNDIGPSVALSMEKELPQVVSTADVLPTTEDGNQSVSENVKPVDPARLSHLTAISMVLSSLWEARTFLRRLYGLTTGKAKVSVKDLTKAPVKQPFVTGDKFWEEMAKIMVSLHTEDLMSAQCRSFHELLTIDKEYQIAKEGEEDPEGGRPSTPSDDEGTARTPVSGGRHGRKRKASGTPSKSKRARSSSRGRGKKGRKASVDSDADGDYDWE
jgi:cohesin loading factor subunit SCC2